MVAEAFAAGIKPQRCPYLTLQAPIARPPKTIIHIKARLDDESIQQLKELHAQWLGQEEQKLADHNKRQETNWQKHSQRLTDIVKNNEGVWISAKLFYVVGSLSLLSIITIAMEIAFYVYFHWIQ